MEGPGDAVDKPRRTAGVQAPNHPREPVLLDVSLTVALDHRDELRAAGHGCASWRYRKMSMRPILTAVSNFVNMRGMKRIIDPDALLLQGAADATRLAILRQLSGGNGVCACDFTACCDVAQPTVSHHLKVLREAGWVSSERRGSNVWYTLRPEAVERFRQIAGELAPVASAPSVRALPVIQPTA
jgi:ArsR family transcriptional regulator